MELATAVPVFVGWDHEQSTDVGVFHKIGSWPDYEAYRGSLPTSAKFDDAILCTSIRLYFENGGGKCFILLVSPPPVESELVTSMVESTEPLLDPVVRWMTAFKEWIEGSLTARKFAPALTELSLTLVAMPQLVGALPKLLEEANSAKLLVSAWRAVQVACQCRPDLFFVWDAPQAMKVADACIKELRINNAFGEMGQHAAVYGPHLLTSYTINESDTGPFRRTVPPCGAVLGLMARTDHVHGTWKAPANEALMCIVAAEHRETEAHGWFDVAKPSINLIRSFPGRGVRVWGCRTLTRDGRSPFRYVQVRRTVTWIEANLRQICRFAVFEPNSAITWLQLRGVCSAWLRRVWLSGGLAGAEEGEAFVVQVGLNDSMLADDIAEGRLIVKVGLAVLHAAEFVELNLVLMLNETQAGMMQLQRSEML
ncbi:phage tail sheath family protein [Burkholderia sp. SIMBA_062]|uniref:phage tail sheath family protein n=1 Tax=Burkholderia sp. SIMBA_062 TaxID=3085803 RepID=UPI00397DDB27